MKNKTTLIVIGAIVALVVICGIAFTSTANSLAVSREAVAADFSKVESQYQRRADLVPNLVKVVQQAVSSEKDILQSVTEARAKATSITIDPTNATQEQLDSYQNAQGQLGSSLGKLLAISEKYPELKSIQGFTDLQTQIEGTENRIAVARNDYGKTAQSYNSKLVVFPASIVASMGGYQKATYFKAEAGSEKAPEIDFNQPAPQK
jgi:LemA protein